MTDYQLFINIGLITELLPIVPPGAPLSPTSTLDASACGKQPGFYNAAVGDWSGVSKWSQGETTIGDIQGWFNWPLHNIGMRTRKHPAIDIDIDDPVLANQVNDMITMLLGDTATRSRVNSSRVVRVIRLAAGEPLQSKRRILLGDHGAIELLGNGQQVVLSGVHPSGNMQTFTGDIITVTVAQLDLLWSTLIATLDSYITSMAGGGASSGVKRGGEVLHVATDEATIQQAREYISDQTTPAEGERNDSCFRIVAHIREHLAIPAETCLDLIQDYAGLPPGEINTIINSAYGGNARSAQGGAHPIAAGFGQAALPPGASLEPVEPVRLPPSPDGVFYLMDQPLPVHEWDITHCNSKGKPYSTPYNFKRMLKLYNIHVAYDVVTKEVIMNGNDMSHSSDVSDNANYSVIFGLCKLNQIEVGVIDQYLNSLMVENEVNPVEQWIQSKPWDGVDRLDQLFNTLVLSPEQNRDVAYMMFRKWFIGAVKIVQRKIDRFEYVLVLQSEQGGEGKTAWFKSLCPDVWRTDGLILDPSDKDTVKQDISHWLVELGELDSTFRKSDVKRLMAYLSMNEDNIRLPYAKSFNKYKRRTAHMGTVNSGQFLQDDSGDRRFWPIAVTAINYEHNINMQQLWSQVNMLNDQHWLNRDENQIVINANKEFKAIEPLHEQLEAFFNREPLRPGTQHLTCTVIAEKIGIINVNRGHLLKIAKWLRDKGYQKSQFNGTRGFNVPIISIL